MPNVLKVAGGLLLILALNAASLWLYHKHYALQIATVDLEAVLKDHVNRYGQMGLDEKQTAQVAKAFGHAMETRLADYQALGYQVFVKQALVSEQVHDLTADLKNVVEADVAPLVQQLQSRQQEP